MNLYSIKETTLIAIGDAIRAKNGSTDTYTSEEFAAAIESIVATGGGEGGSSGGPGVIEHVSITGTTYGALGYQYDLTPYMDRDFYFVNWIRASSSVDPYFQHFIYHAADGSTESLGYGNDPLTTTKANAAKAMGSLANGILTLEYYSSSYAIQKTCHLFVCNAGAGGSGGITPEGEIEITENGNYDVTEYASAAVNVPVGVFPEGTQHITENGTYNIAEYENVLVEVAASGGEAKTITVSGNLPHAFAGDVWGEVFKQFPNLTIEVNRLQDANCMFWKNGAIKRIPFVLNTASDATVNFTQAFYGCSALEEPPVISAGTRISAVRGMFSDCYKLKTFPEGYGADWNWDEFKSYNYADCSNLFYNCYSLRKAPQAILDNAFAGVGSSGNYVGYYNGFASCYNLDEVLNLGVNQGSLTSNRMSYMFTAAYCVKRFTFATNADGTPKTAKWKNQVLELQNLGFCKPTYSWQIDDVTNNCPERTGKRIYDDATYAALKNDADAWTGDTASGNTCYHWSLYNKASALETIKSLPDCSATGTNTIKFKGEAGLKTDGGAINTLTEDEIAIATAKGWTVQFV